MLVFPWMESNIINPLIYWEKVRGKVVGMWDFPGTGVFVEGRCRTVFGPSYRGRISVVKLDFTNID